MIYLAGPIDYLAAEPEARHIRVAAILADLGIRPTVWCPVCQYDPDSGAEESIERNMRALSSAVVMLCEWDATREPSFGTPVELWYRRGRSTILVGSLGRGLFARALEEDVLVLPDWEHVPGRLAAMFR